MRRILRKLNHIPNRMIFSMNWYKNLWSGSLKIYKLNTFGLQVVNTGSGSGVHAFNYDGLTIKGFNFALSPQSLMHDFNILKNYFSYFEKGCTILIPLCPFSGMVVKYPKQHNFRYYPILHPATIPDFDERERTRAFKWIINPFGYYKSLCVKNGVCEVVGMIKSMIIRCFLSSISLQTSADKMISGWKQQFGIHDLSAQIPQHHIDDIYTRGAELKEMLQFCKERAFRPVVVIPPMHPSLYNQLPDVFLSQYLNPLIEVVRANNVLFLDYMKDNGFSNDNLYSSALFLNKQGAKYFTQRVLSDLKLI